MPSESKVERVLTVQEIEDLKGKTRCLYKLFKNPRMMLAELKPTLVQLLESIRVSKKSLKDEDQLYRPPGEKVNTIHPKHGISRSTRSKRKGNLSKGLSNAKKQEVSQFAREEKDRFDRHHT
ncbi:hypothetical protein CRE_19149 [Caenorhabditis remanei]|uniref:Uncharacterized protein n=1 Tax=Caenorhabditis remanei TaxID=31234 RepID=E3MJK1_CAERE|nr:hypothetical protein CRE_19149 [Caenorhabditis remanei]